MGPVDGPGPAPRGHLDGSSGVVPALPRPARTAG
ncbi:hypothetical protein Ae406Ps2_0155c [Pseudonocardia sp. Ae406_Ps2]|nr:hypothetical protein Ae406Ps2_0155c [Pseudonocardia sp. Ae406_Ps2]OLM08051.1 hypothetical protein Ae331Ps2_5761 [Pseudonocardia sp. Ae331_Ps2]OLM13715.1 hypothetical protein Ae505Ps2_3844c [Pseudonocardia sp. Ae505_Ps2]OLM21724.1 hypothetical protein Ae706Ps2_0156c [Pseudonocardia sp. Ae706_Ps2]